MDGLRAAISGVDIRGSSGSSTSKEKRWISRQRLRRSNTIRTAPRGSLFSIMSTGRSAIYSHRSGCVRDTVVSSERADIKPGNTIPLKNIPTGSFVHNVELKLGKGGQIIRSAGSYGQLMAKEGTYAQVRLPSGEVRKILLECKATVGQVGNIDHENISAGKAGRTRWSGRRPKVRGVAMNPVDHPLGGGEGKSSGGRHPVTPWGKPTKGYKTRKNKNTDKYIIKKRD